MVPEGYGRAIMNDSKYKPERTARLYGNPPYRSAVLHGGPGAAGYMAPVAEKLSEYIGVIEPLQYADSVDGQVEELRTQLNKLADYPVTLIGSSWGAMLALFYAARYRAGLKKLILVGSGVFDAENSARIADIRYSRLSNDQKREFDQLQGTLIKAGSAEQSKILKKLGSLFSASDDYDLIEENEIPVEVDFSIHSRVWSDFVERRDRPEELRKEFSRINLPTVVIHGDYDPHPIEGIRPFLESCIDSIEFHILPRCGHYPWKEKHARDKFYGLLQKELTA